MIVAWHLSAVGHLMTGVTAIRQRNVESWESQAREHEVIPQALSSIHDTLKNANRAPFQLINPLNIRMPLYAVVFPGRARIICGTKTQPQGIPRTGPATLGESNRPFKLLLNLRPGG